MDGRIGVRKLILTALIQLLLCLGLAGALTQVRLRSSRIAACCVLH